MKINKFKGMEVSWKGQLRKIVEVERETEKAILCKIRNVRGLTEEEDEERWNKEKRIKIKMLKEFIAISKNRRKIKEVKAKIEALKEGWEEKMWIPKKVLEVTKFINLTPHPIIIYKGEEKVLEVPPSDEVARVEVKQKKVGEINGIPVMKSIFGDVEGLPEKREGTVYIVSLIVLQALKAKGVERSDVVAPDTSPSGAVRDKEGKIIGVRGFVIV